MRQLGSLRPWDHRGKRYTDRKRIQCLSNASQHVPIYLQPFLRYSGISVAIEWFSTVLVSEWAFLTTFCFPWVYAPGTIAVNVTCIEREFNACQTHRIHTYLQPFTSYSEILVGNRNFFLPPLHLMPPYGVAPWTIAVNVTRLERGFNACKTPPCIYPSIFNRFPVIQAWSLKIRNFGTFWPPLCTPLGQSR